MGIDIYMRWDGQTDEEREAQYTGFSITHGHVGYLREAYHGGPYATKVLVPEAFDADDCKASVAASVLRERLPNAVNTSIERQIKIYKANPDQAEIVAKAFIAFVERSWS